MRARPTIRVLGFKGDSSLMKFCGYPSAVTSDHADSMPTRISFSKSTRSDGLRRSTMYAGICRSTGSSLSVAFCAASVAPAAEKDQECSS